MSKVRRLSTKTIDEFTKLGYNELQTGNLNTAIEAFKNAHRHSIYLNDINTEQLCAFNLGAAYVAAKKPKEGLELLSTAVPPVKRPDEKPKGDVYYNFGLGYETMHNMDDTIKYFELAFEAYQEEKRDTPTSRKILTVAKKLGFCYGKIGSCSQAVNRLKIVTKLHDELEEDVEERIPVLCELGSQLATLNKYLEALHYADECFTCCSQLEDSLRKGEWTNFCNQLFL
jgi:tetratricopeptide (TPR) repeat protein